MRWRQLRLLLWKSVYLYKLRRNWAITALELLAPLLLTLVQTYLHCNGESFGDIPLPLPPAGTKFAGPDDDSPSVVRTSPLHFPATIGFVPAPGNVTGEEVLRQAFPEVQLEMFSSEAEMVANLSVRTNSLGLANNYGVVFEQADQGLLSYTLRFPSWQEFYTRQTMLASRVNKQPPFWLNGVLLPIVSRLNMAVAGAEARRLENPLPPVYFQTRRFPAPAELGPGDTARRITDLSVVYGFIVIAPVAVKRIADEKSVGMKELLRIAGVSDAVYWLSAYLSCLLVMLVVAVLLTVLLKVPLFCAPAMLPQSDFTLVLAMIMLYAVYADLFCLLISCVVKTPVYAVFATVCLWMLTYEVPMFFLDVPGSVEYADLSLAEKIKSSVFPNMAVHWIFRIIALHEENNEGAQWSNLRLPGSRYDNVTLVGMILVVCAYCVAYAMAVWYLDNVWPWQYGIPKEPLFFMRLSYWTSRPTGNVMVSESTTDVSEADPPPLEDIGDRTNPGIVLNDVTKVYRNKTVAVRHVSLKAYPGDVTVLLGRNGAGKTTLLRLITGLDQATEGSVYVGGFNVALETDAARHSMGFCPQENVLFMGLTVHEHLQFFARIRSGSWATADEAIEEILQAFNLAEKRDALASSLSWGTMRKLQLGVAIVGSPMIVVLDEPTSGADPECKGALWECVLRFHEDKTMLLTTHSMEEADTLGDRIAVLAAGRLRCCGSPLFLRQHYATGYCIRASMKKSVPTKGVARIILTHVPKSQIQVDDFDTLSANLGDIDVHTLIKLLHKLEEERGELEWLSVYAAALEDVLRKAECGLPESAEQQPNPPAQLSPAHSAPDGTPPSQEHAVEQHLSLVQANRTSAAGMRPNVKQQVGALVLKKLQYARRDFKLPVLMLLLPLSVLLLFVFINQTLISRIMIYSGPLEYSLLKIFGHTVAFFTADENMKVDQEYKRYLTEEEGADVRDLGSDDPSEWMREVAQSNYRRYRARYVIGAEFRSITNVSQLPAGAVVPADHTIEDGDEVTEVTAWHSAYSPHSMAVSVVAASRAFLPGWRLRVVNHPLPRENPKPEPNPVIVLMTRLMCAVFIPVGLAFLAATYVLFPVQERVRNVKLLQLLSGASPAVFWGTSFVVDLALHAFCSLVLLLPFVLLDRHGLYSDFPTLGSIFTLTLSYGFSSIPLAYVVSLLCDQPSTGYVTIASISIVAGMILNVSMTLLYLLPVLTDPPSNETRDTSGLDAALWVFRGIPCFSLAWGVSNCLQISEETIMCRYMSTFDRLVFCKNLILTKIPDHLNHFIECCPETCRDCILSKRYLSWDKMSAGRDVCVMMLVGFALLCLVVLVDSGKASVAYWRTRCAKSPAGGTGTNEERARLARLLSDGRTEQAALVVDNLSKHYGRLQAVRGISFTVRKHECFGLLGMNGAGKTTTFRMLAGDLAPTAGSAYIDDVDLVGNKGKYQARIGYCPQTDVALDFLTGREMLALFGRLRGISEKDLADVIGRTLEFVEMAKYADVTVGKYSGGTRRKLSLAVAFMGSPRVVLLDEPTAAVDPSARRHIWSILLAAKRHLDLAILLSSHCMRECETLCSRVAILREGRFACLGSTLELKRNVGRGALVLVRCASTDEAPLSSCLQAHFPGSELRRRHQGGALLRFFVPAQPWSQLFAGMEELREQGLFSEYMVSDVSLGEVFLHFARSPRGVAKTPPPLAPKEV